MYKYLLALLLAFSLTPAASKPMNFKQILDKPELATTRPDHKIAYGKDAFQYGELWLPTSPVKGPIPVVVLIHGGCWLSDLPGPELVAFLADDLRRHGVAVWSLTYRRVGHKGGGYPGTFDDVANGVAHLRELEVKYHLDLTRVVVTGHSAGGHLALWAAAQKRIPSSSPLKREQLVKFKAVVGIGAVSDLAYFAGVGKEACGDDTVVKLVDAAKRTSIGGTIKSPVPDISAPFRDTSPSEMLPLGVTQILIQGALDPLVVPSNGQRYEARAKAKGENIELITLENAGHFELIAPWTPEGKTVVEKILGALKQ